MPEEPVSEVKVSVVRYEIHECGDTEGRTILRLTPLGKGKLRYRGKRDFVSPEGGRSIIFEIEAASDDEAFERYDARWAEEKEEFEAEQRKAALLAGTPMIDRFRQQRLKRFGGGNGG